MSVFNLQHLYLIPSTLKERIVCHFFYPLYISSHLFFLKRHEHSQYV